MTLFNYWGWKLKTFHNFSENYQQEKRKNTRHWQEIIKDDKAILAYDVHGFSESDLKDTKMVYYN